jgi:8-oxo-dGTP diphosphatase
MELENRPTVMLVVAALICDGSGRVLLQQRPVGKAHAGLWEFPGGKVEPAELPRESLVREIEEELGLTIQADTLHPVAFAETPQFVGTRPIVILLYKVAAWSGTPEAREGGAFAWVEPTEIAGFPMPPLDIDLLSRIEFEKIAS